MSASDVDLLDLFRYLSPSEARTLEALMKGQSVSAVATDRHLAISTIRSQVKSVLIKLDVHSQAAAVALAFRCGWQTYSPTSYENPNIGAVKLTPVVEGCNEPKVR